MKRNSKEVPFQILIVSRKDFLGERIEALKGKKAPELNGTDVASGKKITVSQFAGKPLIVALWATWCPACQEGIPKLNELAQGNTGRLEILAVSYESHEALKSFVAKVPVSYHIVAADTKNLSLNYMNNASIPKYLLVNTQGTVTGVFTRVEDVAQAYRAL